MIQILKISVAKQFLERFQFYAFLCQIRTVYHIEAPSKETIKKL